MGKIGDPAMKNNFLFSLFLLSLFLFGCLENQNPPLPGPIGGSAPVGRAYSGFEVPEGYAPPFDIFENNHTLFNLSQDKFPSVSLTSTVDFRAYLEFNSTQFPPDKVIYPYNLIFKFGYLFDPSPACLQDTRCTFADGVCCKGWRAFQWPGQTVTLTAASKLEADAASVWINYTTGNLTSSPKSFSIPAAQLKEGPNFLLGYACKRVNNQWKCGCATPTDPNCNKWMLQIFTVTIAGCTNGVKDGAETDVDCGGTCPVKCPDTKVCNVPGDCASGVCGSDKKCAVPTCTDTIKNGPETDVDCGGTCPVKCPETKSCTIDADCATNKCDPSTKKCISSTVECASDNDCGLNVQCQCAKKTGTSGTCSNPPQIPTSTCICESQTKKCLDIKSGAFDISIVSTAAGYSPPSVTVLKGTTITWRNNDATVPHTVTHNVASPSFDSGTLNPQQIYRNTFNTAGTFPYKCNFHPGMQGEVKVVEGIPPSTQSTITITSPTEGATVTSAVVPIQFTTANAVGKKIKLFVDGTAQSTLVDAVATGSVNTPSLPNGLHKVELEVVDTNGVSLSPVVKSGERSFTVTVAATCTDNIKNGQETDVDCGGSCPTKCVVDKGCSADGDCQSSKCDATTKKCLAPSCTDSVKNGQETDVDCGGSCTLKCPETKSCIIDADCASNKCDTTTKKCIAPPASCTDKQKNGAETDVDCGGSTCPKCKTDQTCSAGSDCDSLVCTNNKCSAASCIDKTKNGDETDIDCGGSCSTKCAITQTCSKDGDCASNKCDATTKKCVEQVPQVAITSPTESVTVTSTVVPIQFTTANAVGKKIKLSVDGTAQSTLVDAGATGSVNTPSLSNALHRVELEVVDTNGNSLNPQIKSGERKFTVQALPDFQVGEISFDAPTGSNQITIRIKYKNLGTRNYDGTTGNPIKLKYAVKNKDTNAILPNGEGTHSLPVSLLTGDSEQKEDIVIVSLGSILKIQMDVTLDPSNEIPESIETNNAGTNSLDLTLGDPPDPGK